VWAREHKEAAELELLIALARSRDGQECAVPLSRREHLEQKYEGLLRRGLPAHELLAGEHALGYDESIAVKKAFIALDWIAERPLSEIERTHQVWGGGIERLGDELSWLVEAFAEIAAYEKWDASSQKNLRILAARLRVGVREDLLPLAPARTRWVGRRLLRRLFDKGLSSMEALRSASSEDLARAVGPLAATMLQDHLEGRTRIEQPLRKREPSGPRLVLVGEARSHGRVTILADGMERMVSRRHFELLLALSAKDWLPLSDAGGDMDTARKEILRLRKKLATFLRLAPQEVLRTDGRKHYHLTVSMRVDQRSLRKNQPDLATSQP
jgi:hypothetical protein